MVSSNHCILSFEGTSNPFCSPVLSSCNSHWRTEGKCLPDVKYQLSSPKCSLILQYHWNPLLFQKKTLLHKYRQFKTLYQTNDRICKPRDVQLNPVLRMHLTPPATYLGKTMLPHIFFIIFLHTCLLHSELVVSTGLYMVMTNKKLKNILQGQTASQRLSNWSNRD